MKKIGKSDIKFLIALSFFALACFSRFFDEKLNVHTALFSFMQNYEVVFAFTVLYFVILFGFYLICIAKGEKSSKKNIYYLIVFYSFFAFPMFLSADYFGAMDIYAWMLTWIGGGLLVIEKQEWITILICCVISLLSPMSVLSGCCVFIAIHIYKFFAKKGNKYLWFAIGCFVSSALGVLVTKHMGTFSSDVQSVISLKRFVVLILYLSPYLVLAGKFFGGLFCRSIDNKKWGWFFLIVGIVPSSIIYIYLQDYARAFFHVFSYFILNIIICLSINDKDVSFELERTKKIIKKWFPVPVLIIIIPLLFMTLWISGEQVLMTEIFVDN